MENIRMSLSRTGKKLEKISKAMKRSKNMITRVVQLITLLAGFFVLAASLFACGRRKQIRKEKRDEEDVLLDVDEIGDYLSQESIMIDSSSEDEIDLGPQRRQNRSCEFLEAGGKTSSLKKPRLGFIGKGPEPIEADSDSEDDIQPENVESEIDAMISKWSMTSTRECFGEPGFEEFMTEPKNFPALAVSIKTFGHPVGMPRFVKKNLSPAELTMPPNRAYLEYWKWFHEVDYCSKMDLQKNLRMWWWKNFLSGVDMRETCNAGSSRWLRAMEEMYFPKFDTISNTIALASRANEHVSRILGTSTYAKYRDLVEMVIITWQGVASGNAATVACVVSLMLKKIYPARLDRVIVFTAILTHLLMRLVFKNREYKRKAREELKESGMEWLADTNLSVFKIGLSIVLVLAIFVCLWRLPKKSDFDSCFNRFGSFDKNIKGTTALFATSTKAVTEFTDWFTWKYFGKPPAAAEKLFRNEMRKMEQPDFKDSLTWNSANVAQVVTWHRNFSQWWDGLESKERQAHRDLFDRASKLMTFATSTPAAGVTGRVEPVLISLWGKPGVGKTTCLDAIALFQLIHLGYVKQEDLEANDWKRFMYYHKTSDKHWNGYRTQISKVCVFDDANQVFPEVVQGVPTPVNVIWFANSAPTHIEQASLDDKAKNSYFASDIIFLTDNIRHPDMKKVIVEPGAYKRRIDFEFEVVANPKYPTVERTHDGMTWKVPAFSESEGINFDRVLFRRYDPMRETDQATQFYTYEQVCELILERVKEKKSYFRQNETYLRDVGMKHFLNFESRRMEAQDRNAAIAAAVFGKTEPQPSTSKSQEPMREPTETVIYDSPEDLQESGAEVSVEQKPVDFAKALDKNLAEEMWQRWIVNWFKKKAFSVKYWFSNLFKKEEEVKNGEAKKAEEKLLQILGALTIVVVAVWLVYRVVKKKKNKNDEDMIETSYQIKSRNVKDVGTKFVKKINLRTQTFQESSVETMIVAPSPWKENVNLAEKNVVAEVNVQGLQRIWKNFSHFKEKQHLRDFVGNRLFGNTYLLTVHRKKVKPGYCSVNCVFVKGTAAITVRHIFRHARSGDDVIIGRYQGDNWSSISIPYDELKFRALQVGEVVKDTLYIEFPSQYVKPHTDIISSFVKEKEALELEEKRFGHVGYLPMREGGIEMPWVNAAFVDGAVYNEGLVYRSNCNQFTSSSGPSLIVATEGCAGVCGTPLYSVYGKNHRRVYGILVGSGSVLTAAAICTQEEIEFALATMSPVSMISPEKPENSVISDFVEPLRESSGLPLELNSPGMEPLADLNVPIYHSSETQVAPSLAYEMITKATTKPCYLRHPEMDIDLLNLTKYARPRSVVPKSFVNKFKLNVRKRIQGMAWTKATLEEAVKGRTNQKPMNRSTSPGFPWMYLGGKGKKNLLGEDEYEINPLIETSVKLLEDTMRKGLMPFVLWIDQKKDERLPIEKVEKGKCRYFAIGPVDFNIVSRQYLMSFSEWMIDNRIRNGSLVGIFSEKEMGDVRTTFARNGINLHSANFIDGDYSAFDASLNRQLILAIAEEFCELLPEQERIVLMVIFLVLCTSKHVHRGVIYELQQSQPSGNVFTTFLNTIYNLALIETLFENAYLDLGISIPRVLPFFVVAYGDDNIIGFSDNIVPFTDNEFFAKVEQLMRDYGHTYTTGMKDGSAFELKKLSEVKILKRSFLWDNDEAFCFAPLDIDVVMEQLNWDRAGKNMDLKRDQLCVNIDKVFQDLTHHPKWQFEQFAQPLRNLAQQFKAPTPLQFYNHGDLRQHFLENIDFIEASGEKRPEWAYNFPQMDHMIMMESKSNHAGGVEYSQVFSDENRTFMVPNEPEDPEDYFWDYDGLLERFDSLWFGQHELLRVPVYLRVCSPILNKWWTWDLFDRPELEHFVCTTTDTGYWWSYAVRGNPKPNNSRRPIVATFDFFTPDPYIKFFYTPSCAKEEGEYVKWHSARNVVMTEVLYTYDDGDVVERSERPYEYPIREEKLVEASGDVNGLVEDVQKILTIEDVEQPQVSEVPLSVEVPYFLEKTTLESHDYSLRDIVTRAHTLASMAVVGGSPGDRIAHLSFPNDLFSIAQIGETVSNFKFFKANVKVKIIVTAAPTAAFALRMTMVGDVNPLFLNNRSLTPLQQSQFDNVLLVGPQLVRAEQILPWVSPMNARDTTTTLGNNGSVNLYIVVPPTEQIRVQLICNFEDDSTFDMSFPYAGPRLLYMTKPLADKYSKDVVARFNDYHLRKIKGVVPTRFTEAGIDEAMDMAKEGVKTGVRMAGALKTSGSLNLMKNVASTAVTASARLLGAMGWSKPNSEEVTRPVKQGAAPDHVNAHGLQVGQTFGIDRTNSIATPSGRFGSAVDDMDFQKFLTHPNYIGQFTINTTMQPGHLLATLAMSPFNGGSWSNIAEWTTDSIGFQMLPGAFRIWSYSLFPEVRFTGFGGTANVVALQTWRNVGATQFVQKGQTFSITWTAANNLVVFTSASSSFQVNVTGNHFYVGVEVLPEQRLLRAMTTQEMVANLFDYWIGTMRFDFQAVCTAFHSVKLRFVKMPGVYDTTDISWDNIGGFESTIVEFGANTTHQESCSHPSAWNFRENIHLATPGIIEHTERNCVGIIAIYVQEPLQVTSAVAGNSISMFVEQSCRDMKFGRPTSVAWVPMIGDLPNPENTTQETIVVDSIEKLKGAEKYFTRHTKMTPALSTLMHAYKKQQEEEKRKNDAKTPTANEVKAHARRHATKEDCMKEIKRALAAGGDISDITSECLKFGEEGMMEFLKEASGDLSAVRPEGAMTSGQRFDAPAVNQGTSPEGIDASMVLATMGEDITNMRQFGMQYQEMLTAPSPVGGTYKTYILNVTRTAQHSTPLMGQVGRLDYIAAPYSFFHGSMNVRIFKKDLINNSVVFACITSQEYTERQPRLICVASENPQNRLTRVDRAIPVTYVQEGVFNVHVPAYNPCSLLRNTPINVGVNTVDEPRDQWLMITVRSTDELTFSLCFGDDRCYGRPVGLPQYLLDVGHNTWSSPTFVESSYEMLYPIGGRDFGEPAMELGDNVNNVVPQLVWRQRDAPGYARSRVVRRQGMPFFPLIAVGVFNIALGALSIWGTYFRG